MSFLDEILATVRDLPHVGTAPAEVDLIERERRFFRAFEERERPGDSIAKNAAANELIPWLPEGVTSRFFALLAKELNGRVGLDASTDALADLLDTGGLWCAWGDPRMVAARLGDSSTRASPLIEAVKRARLRAAGKPTPAGPIHYLRELGLILVRPGGWALTATGGVLQGLAGRRSGRKRPSRLVSSPRPKLRCRPRRGAPAPRLSRPRRRTQTKPPARTPRTTASSDLAPAARRWLLHLEVRQSLGPMDDWRIHSSALAALLREGELYVNEYPTHVEEVFPWSTCSVERLIRFDLADESQGPDGRWSAVLRDEARTLIEECLADPPAPMAVLADSLARDVEDRALEPWIGASPTSRSADNLLAARMVAHEIRNAILPVRTVLGHLFADAGSSLDAYTTQRARRESGLNRALSFADEQLRVAELGRPSRAPFAVGDAIATALRATEPERNGRVSVTVLPGGSEIRVTGARQVFEQALVNLVRNAGQARPNGPIRVEIGVSASDGLLTLSVDDDGPGVAAADRERIFEAGVSLKGSTGQGLSLARTAVAEMRGRIWCEPSPLGGARFTIQLPVLPRTP